MNMPVVHRLAAGKKSQVDKGRLKSNRERLTKVFGGDYWKDILWQSSLSASEKENRLIDAYMEKLKQYLPYTGSCPVRVRRESRIKYFIVFASRHKDAMLLLNDIMVNAYFSRMHQADFQNTLFQEFSWRDMLPVTTEDIAKLEDVIIKAVSQSPGETRADIWVSIVKQHFMRYVQGDYKKTVNALVKAGKLSSSTPRRNSMILNDECRLELL